MSNKIKVIKPKIKKLPLKFEDMHNVVSMFYKSPTKVLRSNLKSMALQTLSKLPKNAQMQISVQYPNFHYMSGEWFSLSNFMNKMMIFSYGYVYPDEDDVDEKGKPKQPPDPESFSNFIFYVSK